MKLLLKRPHLIIVFIVAVIIFMVINIYSSPVSILASGVQSNEITPANKNLLSTIHNEQQQVSNPPIIQYATSEKYSLGDEWPTISGSPTNKEEIDQWLYSRGYTSSLSGKDEEYKSYSLEALKTLANGGDINAMLVLAGKIAVTNETESKLLIKRAAAFGSTRALQLLAIDIEYSASLAKQPLPAEEKRKLQLESMAYYEVAALRGDKVTWHYGESSFKNAGKIDFTETEWQQIKASAKIIYNELQQQRTELGLGEFDNSVPDSVKKYADILTAPKSKNSCDLPENKAECDRLLAEMKNK